MKKLFIIGDLHLTLRYEWSRKAFNLFFDWIKNLDVGTKEDAELLLLGDVTDSATIPGGVMAMLTEFYTIVEEKFSTVYTLGGNHCQKLINNQVQSTTEFLADRQNHVLIYEETILKTKNGFDVVALPYKRMTDKILDDYYSRELPKEFYEKHDILVGHVAIKEPKTFYGGIDIENFFCKRFAFGHIHARNGIHAEKYTGSILPFRVDEQEQKLPRCIKVFSLDQSDDYEIPIPPFIKYVNVKYGEKPEEYLKTVKDVVYILTVEDCPKKLQAVKEEYQDYNIRAVIGADSKLEEGDTEVKQVNFITPGDALDAMLDENNIILKRKTKVFLKNCLSGVFT